MPPRKIRPRAGTPSAFLRNMPVRGQTWRDVVTGDQVTIDGNWVQGYVVYVYKDGTRKDMQTKMFMERFEKV